MALPRANIIDPTLDPTPALQFSIFFVYCLVLVVVLIFFFFYFNRAIASLISRFFGYWLWRNYRAYVEVESIKLALLGGRISFRNLRYIAENQSISVLQGHITFRYWEFSVRHAVDVLDFSPLVDSNPNPGIQSSPSMKPCRICIRVKGLEWNMYNRTPVFDWIEDQFLKGHSLNRPSSSPSSESVRASHDPFNIGDESRSPNPLALNAQPWYLNLFPIEFISGKGSIVIGNSSIPTIIALDWRKASGSYSTVPSRSPLDIYKQLIQLTFNRGQLQLRANVDHEPPASTNHLNARTSAVLPVTNTSTPGALHRFPSITKRTKNPFMYIPGFVRKRFFPDHSNQPGLHEDYNRTEWQGLNRYQATSAEPFPDTSIPYASDGELNRHSHVQEIDLDSGSHKPNLSTSATPNNQPTNSNNQLIEYAQVHKVIQFSTMSLTYYSDVVGLADPNLSVIDGQPEPNSSPTPFINIGNGGTDPEWGVDLVFNGATIHYGPWADRQRIALQHVFFPNAFRDTPSTPKLQPGEPRVHSNFRVYVRFLGRTIWRVPTREPSKDVSQAGTGLGMQSSNRPYGWFDVVFNGGSVTVFVPNVVDNDTGCTSISIINFESVNVPTSVNYVDFLTAKHIQVTVRMPSPRKWNAHRQWDISTSFKNPVLYILRDHITLIQDLIADFGAADPRMSDLHNNQAVFVPIDYKLELALDDMTVFLCVNELNVIDVPNDMLENNHVRISSQHFQTGVIIPLNCFQPHRIPISFEIKCTEVQVDFSFSASTTLGAFLTPEATKAANASRIIFSGSYTYTANDVGSTPSPDNLEINIMVSSGKIVVFGFLVKYLIILVDNYAGLTPEFMTLDEFKWNGGRPALTAVGSPLDMCLSLDFNEFQILFPETLFVLLPSKLSKVDVPHATLEVRSTQVYMDVVLDIWTMEYRPFLPGDVLTLAGISLHGHRLFGLPPINPEYAASWEISMDSLSGRINVESLAGFFRFFSVFEAHVADIDNCIVPPVQNRKNAISVTRGDIESLDMIVHVGAGNNTFVRLQIVDLHFCNKDIATCDATTFLSASSVTLVHVLATDPSNKFIQPDSSTNAVEVASIRSADISLSIVRHCDRNSPEYLARIQHLKKHDSITSRLSCFFGELSHDLNKPKCFIPPFDFVMNDPGVAQLRKLRKEGTPNASPNQFSSKTKSETKLSNTDSIKDETFNSQTSIPASQSRRFVTHNSSLLRRPFSVINDGDAIPYICHLRKYHPITVNALGDTDTFLLGHSSSKKEPNVDPEPPTQFFSRLHSALNDKTVLVQVACLGFMEIVLTPTALNHVHAFAVERPTCDTLLDSLYLLYLQTALSESNDSASSNTHSQAVNTPTIGLALRSITLTLIQDSVPSSPSLSTPELIKTEIALACLNAALGSNEFRLSIHDLDVISVTLPPNPRNTPHSFEDTILSASIRKTNIFESDKILGSSDGVEVNVYKPDVLPGVFSRWNVSNVNSPSHAEAFLTLASLVSNPNVPNPVFFSQPSNLWRLNMRPHQHKIIWKILCLFRAYLHSPSSRIEMENTFLKNGLLPFTEKQVIPLLQLWKIDLSKSNDLQETFSCLWNRGADSTLKSMIDMLASKIQRDANIKLNSARLVLEDSEISWSEIQFTSQGGEQILLHTDHLNVRIKSGALAQAKLFFDEPSRLFGQQSSLHSPVVASTATGLKPARVPLSHKSDRHIILSFVQVNTTVQLPKVSLELKLNGITASLLIHSQGSTPNSISWSIDACNAVLATSLPIVIISLKNLSGLSASKHLACIEELAVDLPQNIIQIYTFLDEWKSTLDLALESRPSVSSKERPAESPRPFSGLDIVMPKITLSLGALPSLSVISHLHIILFFTSPLSWVLEILKNDLGFLYSGQSVPVVITLPTVKLDARGQCTNIAVGMLTATLSSDTLQPLETSLSLLSREINDVLELLLYVSPRYARSKNKPTHASNHFPTGPDSRINIVCEGISMSMGTSRGAVQITSNLITGSQMENMWSFDSSDFSLAFYAVNQAQLARVRFSLSLKSTAEMLHLTLSQFDMNLQPKAILQIVNLMAFIAKDALILKKAKESEFSQLSATAQKVIETLDVQPPAFQAPADYKIFVIGKRNLYINIDSLACHLLVDANHSTELTLQDAALQYKTAEKFHISARAIQLRIDNSTISIPESNAVGNGVEGWVAQVHPYQLTVQSQFLPSLEKIVREMTSATIAAQTLFSSFASATSSHPLPSDSNSSEAEKMKDLPPLDITIMSGKGVLIDSQISMPPIRCHLDGSIIRIQVAGSHNVLQPSVVNIIFSLLGAPNTESPVPEKVNPSPEIINSDVNNERTISSEAASPFQVVFIVEPTIIELKGRKSKCLAQIKFQATCHVDLSLSNATVLVPNLSFGIHHPFATEDCVLLSFNELLFVYSTDYGIMGDIPCVEAKVVLRHYLEISDWFSEWITRSGDTIPRSAEKPFILEGGNETSNETIPSSDVGVPVSFPHSLLWITSVDVSVQMGQAIGIGSISLSQVFLFAQNYTIHAAIKNGMFSVRGRLQSQIDLRTFHTTIQFQNHQSAVEAGLGNVSGTFQYQTTVVTVLDVTAINALLLVKKSSCSVDLRVEDAIVLTSSRAAPAMLNVFQRFKDLVGLSDNTPSSPGLNPVILIDPKFVGHVTVILSLINLHVFGESLLDPEHITLAIQRPMLHLTVNQNEHRVLKTRLDRITIVKVSLVEAGSPNSPPKDVHEWVLLAQGSSSGTQHHPQSTAPSEGRPAASQRQTKLIAQVPKSNLTMQTWTDRHTNTDSIVHVRHIFHTQFDDMIDLALNMILYRNLQDVIELYQSEIARTMRTLQIISGQTGLGSAPTMVFDPAEPPVLIPRLRVMGEATPPLEWLLNKDTVPQVVHKSITLVIDNFLRCLANIGL